MVESGVWGVEIQASTISKLTGLFFSASRMCAMYSSFQVAISAVAFELQYVDIYNRAIGIGKWALSSSGDTLGGNDDGMKWSGATKVPLV